MATDDAGREATGITVKHPAKYSKSVMNTITREVQRLVNAGDLGEWHVLDPFGGVGGIFDLHIMEGDYEPAELTFKITCVEIEEEWADTAKRHQRFRDKHDQVFCLNFFDYAARLSVQETFDLVVVSPTYGNRMADHHEAKDDSKRNTYRHTLGRPLTPGSSAEMQWGPDYRMFHALANQRVFNLLRPGGYFFLNVKDHIRKGEKQPVAAWHKSICTTIGFTPLLSWQCAVGGNRHGENHEVRVDSEQIYLFQKPWKEGRVMRIMKGKRETPCCRQQVRVKIVEPGYYSRICPLCKGHNVFVLEKVSLTGMDGLLRMRWLTDGEMEAMYQNERTGLAEVGLEDL